MVPSHSRKHKMSDVSIDTGLENAEKRLPPSSNSKGTNTESLQSMDSMQLQPSEEVDDSSILETSERSKNQSSVLDFGMSSSNMADQSSSVLQNISKYMPSNTADQSSVLTLDSASDSSKSILDGLSNANNSPFAKEQGSLQGEDDINILATTSMMNQSSLNDKEFSLSHLNKQENSDDQSNAYDFDFENRNVNGSSFSLDLSQIMNPDKICSKLQDICNEIKNEKKTADEAFVDLNRFLEENAPFNSTDDLQLTQLIGKEVIEMLQKQKSLKDNLHLLAFFRGGHMRKEDADRLLAPKFISNDIWNEAGKHRLLVGVGKVDSEEKQIRHRRHIEEKTIQDFVEWLNAADLLQNLAYGEKIVMVNGFHVAIESVKRTTSIQNIIRQYYWQFLDGAEKDGNETNIDENDDSIEDANDFDDANDSIPFLKDRGYESADEEDDEDYVNQGKRRSTLKDEDEDESKPRCSQICRKSQLRCFLKKGHKIRHKYTPKGLLSPSTITKLLLELTSGEIKSRAGLDNIDVIKGHENFERMSELAGNLYSIINTDEVKEKVEVLKKQISTSETFHKTKFIPHLDMGSNQCMCVECGLFDEKEDRIDCKKEKDHKTPCKDCQDSFKVILELFSLQKEAENVAEDNGLFLHNPSSRDDIETMKHDILLCANNLIDYRAHLVHKYAEAKFDESFYNNLDVDEAVVICDWKMKILASKYREAQAEWFSKRGMSLLGFELHIKGEDGNMQAYYHFFVTDDTTQDTESVLCAKHYVYTKILPHYKIKKVHFRSDGAGCFSSKEAKAMMPIWDEIAKSQGGAYEATYKVSVAGCGKTALDGVFGVLTMHLFRLVNHGHSYDSAEDIFRLLEAFPLEHTLIHLMKPKRKSIPIPNPKSNSGLSSFHIVHYDRKKRSATAKYHSQYSVPITFTVHPIEGLTRMNTEVRNTERVCVIDNIESLIDAKEHIVKSTFNPEKKDDIQPSHLNIVSYDQRKVEQGRSNMERKNTERSQKIAERFQFMKYNGVYCCDSIDSQSKSQCMCLFASEQRRDKHKRNGKHKYPTPNLESWVQELHLSGKFAFSLATGTRINRSQFISSERKLEINDGAENVKQCPEIGDAWYKCGCYRKRSKNPFRATPALLLDLEALFLQGFETEGPKTGKNKYTPDQALVFLQNLKKDDGRRKYSYDRENENGHLPTKQYIQGWFSRRKNKMAEVEKEKANRVNGASNQPPIQNVPIQSSIQIIDDVSNEDPEVAAEFTDPLTFTTVVFDDFNDSEVREKVREILSTRNFSAKKFYGRLLEIDDYLHKKLTEKSYKNIRADVLKEMCAERGNLPTDDSIPSQKEFLRLDNRVKQVKKSSLDLKLVVLQHEAEEANVKISAKEV